MEKEIEDLEFDTLLAEKRHNGIVTLLSKILTELNKDKDGKTNALLEKQIKSVEAMVSSMKSLNPEVNVEVNQNQVIKSIHELGDQIIKGLNDLKKSINQKRSYKFKFKRYDNGYIEEVDVTQT